MRAPNRRDLSIIFIACLRVSESFVNLPVSCFGSTRRNSKGCILFNSDVAGKGESSIPPELKAELELYMKVRQERKGDEEAEKEVGKVIGGTKGNPVLDYVSAAPNKAVVKDEKSNIFDYDELEKYGFGNLVAPIMDAGGRFEVYKLMNVAQPALPKRLQPKPVRKVTIDRTGETDQSRYTGLKVMQIVDDDAIGRALEEARTKKKKPTFSDQIAQYELPFSDVKKKELPSPKPWWTPEKIDEDSVNRGRLMDWKRNKKEERAKIDPMEKLELEGSLRYYCLFASLLTTFAFGRSTPIALNALLSSTEMQNEVTQILQSTALIILLAGIGSSLFCAFSIAPEKNRDPFVWGIKGFWGGPLAIRQLKSLETKKIQKTTGM